MIAEQHSNMNDKRLLSGKYNLIMNLTPQGEIYDVYDGIYHIACICFYSDRMECFMNYKTFTDSVYKHIYGDITLSDRNKDIKYSLIGLSLRVHSMFKTFYILCDDEQICKRCGNITNIEHGHCVKCKESQRGI